MLNTWFGHEITICIGVGLFHFSMLQNVIKFGNYQFHSNDLNFFLVKLKNCHHAQLITFPLVIAFFLTHYAIYHQLFCKLQLDNTELFLSQIDFGPPLT